MTTYQFTCARRNDKGELEVIDGLVTPPVDAQTPTQAIHHPDTAKYCAENNCTVYRVVS